MKYNTNTKGDYNDKGSILIVDDELSDLRISAVSLISGVRHMIGMTGMTKFFNTAGPCRPELHYMVDPLPRLSGVVFYP